jgi:hypothetical protein
MFHRLGLLLTLAVVAALPATASAAAPDHSGALSAASTKFAWEGSGSGAPIHGGDIEFLFEFAGQSEPFPCDAPAGHDCEFALLEVSDRGDLTVTAAADGAQAQSTPELPLFGTVGLSYPDIDMYVYRSNAAGEVAEDEEDLADGAAAGSAASETFTLTNLAAGFYLVKISFYAANDAAYAAEAKLDNAVAPVVVVETPAAPPAPAAETPAPAAEPAPAPVAQSQPAAQAAPAPVAKKPVSKKAACQKKAKKIKNKAKRKKAMKKCAKLK